MAETMTTLRVAAPVTGARALPSLRTSPRWIESRLGVAALLLLVAVAVRVVQFGNPVIQVDDQFYLMVADRMWGGALPYVDIWDRKPVGLFLLYGAIRLLGGDGVVQYQGVATLFAAATAFTIACIADRIADRRGAVLAGVAYLLFLGMFGGDGGQSPVFYNLFVAAAALAIVRIVERPGFDGRALALGCGAMLLMGIAMQVKYTALFEGGYFGLALLWKARRERTGWVGLGLGGTLWLTIGVAPTLAAWGYYAAIGQDAAFLYANFGSIFERRPEDADLVLGRLVEMVLKLTPLLAAAAYGRWPTRMAASGGHAGDPAVHGFVVGWAATAILGVLVFGSYFDHYALPMLVPLAVAAAPILGDFRSGIALVVRGRRHLLPAGVFVLVFAGVLSARVIDRERYWRGTGDEVREIAAFVEPRLQGSCLFVYDGEPILYELTHSCLPTRWPFPDHLNNQREDGAIGVDALTETQRIMAGKPRIVVSSDLPEDKMNLATWNYMQGALAADYRPAARWKIGKRQRVVYERKPDA